ncbi:MAG: cupin domain-containing protein [Smithella sp.]
MLAAYAAASCACERNYDTGDRAELPLIPLKSKRYLCWHCRRLPQCISIEQTGYLIEGKIRLTIGEQVFEVEKDDSWCIPGNVKHSAKILKDSVAIEVFSSVRDEYIPQKVK